NEVYAAMFDVLASRKQGRAETSVESIAREAAVHTNIDSYKDAIPRAKAVAESGAAEYKSGRHAKATRLCWTHGLSLTEVGRIAQGNVQVQRQVARPRATTTETATVTTTTY